MRKVVVLILALAVAALLVPILVVNRKPVTLLLDPFGREIPLATVDIPLSALMFLVFMLGLLIGGIAVWLSQGKWRRAARTRTREAHQWRSEADRLTRERDDRVDRPLASSIKALTSR